MFSPAEKASIEPPTDSTIFLQITRPKPMPSALTPADYSALPNARKSCAFTSSSKPRPVSITLHFKSSLWVSQDVTIWMVPPDVNFKAFFTRLIRICFKRIQSPTNMFGKRAAVPATPSAASTLNLLPTSCIYGLNIALMNSSRSLILKCSFLATNLPSQINFRSRVSFTRLRSKLICEITTMSACLAIGVRLLCSMSFWRNMSDVERGVRNSCTITV